MSITIFFFLHDYQVSIFFLNFNKFNIKFSNFCSIIDPTQSVVGTMLVKVIGKKKKHKIIIWK